MWPRFIGLKCFLILYMASDVLNFELYVLTNGCRFFFFLLLLLYIQYYILFVAKLDPLQSPKF